MYVVDAHGCTYKTTNCEYLICQSLGPVIFGSFAAFSSYLMVDVE